MTEIQTTQIEAELWCKVEVSTQDPKDEKGTVTLRIVDSGHRLEALLLKTQAGELIEALQRHVARI